MSTEWSVHDSDLKIGLNHFFEILKFSGICMYVCVCKCLNLKCFHYSEILGWDFLGLIVVAEWDSRGGEEDCIHIEWSRSAFWGCCGWVLFEISLILSISFYFMRWFRSMWFLICRAEVVVSPPFVFLPLVKSLLRSDFHVAAQNCWVRKGGAFTGEIRYVLHRISSSLFHRSLK